MQKRKNVAIATLLLLFTIALSSSTANQAWGGGRNESYGYASEIHTSDCGLDVTWTEGFETLWPPQGWGVAGNIQNETANPYGGTFDAKASCSSAGSEGAIWHSVPLSSTVTAEVYVKFLSLDVPTGSETRLELVSLQGGSWQYMVAASINNPYGTMRWTLETFEGGTVNYNYNTTDTPTTGTWYRVEVARNVTTGQATLRVNGVTKASQSRSMTENTNIIGMGICYQSAAGNNQVCIDNITIAANGNPTVGYENNYVQWATDDVYNEFADRIVYVWDSNYEYYQSTSYTYGRLWNYMENYESTTTVNNVLGCIDNDDNNNNHDYATFLYIGHNAFQSFSGNTHYGFLEGGTGENSSNVGKIWDCNISSVSDSGKFHFVFLWVCRDGTTRGGAGNPPYGMPYCWTQGQIINGTGYNNTDNSGYCLISFDGASPMLCQYIGSTENQLYKHWLVFFYHAAVTLGCDVNGALDWASMMTGYSGGFNEFPSYNNGNGNQVWWNGADDMGMGPSWQNSTMRVYGDGTINLPGDIFTGGGQRDEQIFISEA
jgi:hypothetical protein